MSRLTAVLAPTSRPFVAQHVAFSHRPGHSLTPQRHVTHNQQVCSAATLQFIKGIDEPSVPDVRLTRSKDGSSGTATFVFDTPSVFESSEELGDITGLFMIDDEGEFSTVDVQAKFVNGKPDRIEAKYIMRSAFEWDRFMRYMERYAEQQGLGFQKTSAQYSYTYSINSFHDDAEQVDQTRVSKLKRLNQITEVDTHVLQSNA